MIPSAVLVLMSEVKIHSPLKTYFKRNQLLTDYNLKAKFVTNIPLPKKLIDLVNYFQKCNNFCNLNSSFSSSASPYFYFFLSTFLSTAQGISGRGFRPEFEGN